MAPRNVSVATASAKAPIPHKATPTRSTPPPNRAPMMMTTPITPAKSPTSPNGRILSPKAIQPKAATNKGMVDAMIAAKDASIDCMATKFSPR